MVQINKISQRIWGNVDGNDVYLFKMINQNGEFVEISNYGATLVSFYTYDRQRNLGNIVLGFPSLQGYVNDQCYLGSTIGRFANRIANANFSVDGKVYILEENDGSNHNHSGRAGFHKKVFSYEINADRVVFKVISADGDGGFPGTLKVQVHYYWTANNELGIEYFGETDKATLFNLTNHSYFNLSALKGNVFEHRLRIFADQVVEAGTNYIPTGDIIAVDDANSFRDDRVGAKMTHCDGKVVGINTCYVLNPERQAMKLPAAILYDPFSGRRLSVYTSYPGLLLYTGDYLNTTDWGNHCCTYQPFDGLCLEAQFFPDSPNHSTFPSPVLLAGTTAHHTIVFRCDTLN